MRLARSIGTMGRLPVVSNGFSTCINRDLLLCAAQTGMYHSLLSKLPFLVRHDLLTREDIYEAAEVALNYQRWTIFGYLAKFDSNQPILDYKGRPALMLLANIITSNSSHPCDHVAIEVANEYKSYFEELSKIVSINQVGSSGKTAFTLILDSKDWDFIDYALKLGADINCPDSQGNTILHLLMTHNAYPISVEQVLAQDPDVSLANAEGLTPLDLYRSRLKFDNPRDYNQGCMPHNNITLGKAFSESMVPFQSRENRAEVSGNAKSVPTSVSNQAFQSSSATPPNRGLAW